MPRLLRAVIVKINSLICRGVTMFRTVGVSVFSLLIVIGLMSGCSAPQTKLTTGMKTQDAIDKMSQRKLKSSQMAFSSAHNAYDLPDGRTVVIFGTPTVTEIQVIDDAGLAKADRKVSIVQTVSFK